jgi:Holliday junction resolvase RusA-like endonuclease
MATHANQGKAINNQGCQMSVATIVVYGKPKAQPRVRPSMRGNKLGVYMPKTADDYRGLIIQAWRARYANIQFTGAVQVRVMAYFPIPKSKQKDCPLFCTSKPDGDNILKAVLDALTQAGAWGDDAGVASMSIDKRYTKTDARTEIDILGQSIAKTK